MIIKVNGIVIREYTIGESDKYITLFTKELGKIQVSAPRAKKYVKGLAAGTQLFVYGEFMVSGYQGTYKLLSAEPTYMFQGLSRDLAVLSYATYFAEFVSEVSDENSGNGELLTLMLYALHNLSKPDSNVLITRCVFELRAMVILGFMPQLKTCLNCACEIELLKEARFFSVEQGGILCSKCKGYEPSFKIDEVTWYTLLYITYTPIKKVYQFKVDDYVLKQLKPLIEAYVTYYIEKKFKTLEFIESIESII